MAVWVVTGKLGGGKSLVSVSRIRDALSEGKKVATNLDIHLDAMFSKYSKASLMRIPDKPTVHDMDMIGIGNESYDEELNGLIVLDELGTWLNSRSWQDKTRKALLDWFLHARKKGWDVIFIVQDVSIIDNQFRESLAELTVFCRRLDRMTIPIIAPLYKLISGGDKLPLPKIHFGRVVYGTSPTDMQVDRWVYRGTDLYKAYDTRQIFIDDYDKGAYSYLPPDYFNWRTRSAQNWRNTMRKTKIMWKRFSAPIALGSGLLIGAAGAVAYVGKQVFAAVEPLAQVEQSEVQPEPQEQSYEVERTKELLGTLYIRGTHNVTGRMIYELADLNDEDKRTVLTDIDLRQMGLMVRHNGKCRLDVQVGNELFPVFCVQSM